MPYLIEDLGSCDVLSPLGLSSVKNDFVSNFVSDQSRIVVDPSLEYWNACMESGESPDTFELAGPRNKIFFQPSHTKAAIVTCGGLCPGLNDVIRALVMVLYYHYGVEEILGIKFGYHGMTVRYGGTAQPLSPGLVADIHSRGGTYLGSSRGSQNITELVDFLQRREINMLFTVGGDGTLRGAVDIVKECHVRDLKISVIGIPKTIDNDIAYIDRSFGFSSAVAKAKEVIDCAHAEASGALNGIGLVKLMGRHSGCIAARAALASGHANFVLIPEIPFDLRGENSFLCWLKRRIETRHHALVVVAEGAGQDMINQDLGKDESGNIRLADIGTYLKDQIGCFFKEEKIPVTIKYFDPSYLIRSTTANAEDGVFCFELAQNAVHAAMAGKTNTILGTWNSHFVHIPMELAISKRKVLDPDGPEWLAVTENTGQPLIMTAGSRNKD
jgi:6-phosphofructokinase 1